MPEKVFMTNFIRLPGNNPDGKMYFITFDPTFDIQPHIS